MSINADAKRIERFLQRRRLLFVELGARASDDRAISTHNENRDGATISNPEYTALLRDLARVARGERVK